MTNNEKRFVYGINNYTENGWLKRGIEPDTIHKMLSFSVDNGIVIKTDETGSKSTNDKLIGSLENYVNRYIGYLYGSSVSVLKKKGMKNYWACLPDNMGKYFKSNNIGIIYADDVHDIKLPKKTVDECWSVPEIMDYVDNKIKKILDEEEKELARIPQHEIPIKAYRENWTPYMIIKYIRDVKKKREIKNEI